MARTVLIIGGGLAGITTALRLSERGYHATVIEQGSRWGGQFVTDRPTAGDPLPTVLLGCHHATQALLTTLGTASRVPLVPGLSFEFVTQGRGPVRLRRPWIPAPWSTLLSLAIFRALSVRDRWTFFNWIERTWERDPALPTDLDNHTAEAWLRGIGQSEGARVQTWTPLSRFLLGNDLKTVSAAMLLGMLIRCFASTRRHSMLAVPNDTLDRLIAVPACRALAQAGAIMRSDTPADQIEIDTKGVTGVRLRDGVMLTADRYVASLSPQALSALLPERAVTRFSYFQQLPLLGESAAIAVHLRVNVRVLRPRVLLLADRSFHWMVLRSDPSDERKLLASFVATGQSTLLEQSDKEVVDLATADLCTACPGTRRAQVDHYDMIRVPHAFLSVRPRITALRPLQQSPLPNFFLAGDWTDTALPSSVEGAILSGELCAAAIGTKDAG